jgi:NitT/TauT family transport system permease protein
VLDQLVFRPLVVWAQKFRVEEGGHAEAMSSWFYEVLRRSALVPALAGLLDRIRSSAGERPAPRAHAAAPRAGRASAGVSRALFAGLVVLLGYGAFRLLELIAAVPLAAWRDLAGHGVLTLGRVLLATVVGTAWALPAGLAVGLSPRLSRVVQPIAQVAASFPAPMLFPAVVAVLRAADVSLDWGSIVLMLLGTQWYIFFNVIAGAIAIPADLREAAVSYRFGLWHKLRAVYLPSVFPQLVTGWVTAAGGAWNASIVSEYMTFKDDTLSAKGLGADISSAAAHAQFPMLAAAVAVMSLIVVLFNRTVWRTCYRIAETRFSLDK